MQDKVLRPQGDSAFLENPTDQSQIRERRTDGDTNAKINGDGIRDLLRQLTGNDAGRVHFPVADDEFLTHQDAPCPRVVCLALVRLAGRFVARFDRLRFRRALLSQEDAEPDEDRDRQILCLPGLQG